MRGIPSALQYWSTETWGNYLYTTTIKIYFLFFWQNNKAKISRDCSRRTIMKNRANKISLFWECYLQCFVSGSALILGSRMANMIHKNFKLWSAGYSLFRAEGFSSSLDVVRGGLEIDKLELFDKKRQDFFCLKILHFTNPGSRSALTLKCWIRIRIKSLAKRKASCAEWFSKVQELILLGQNVDQTPASENWS